MERRKRKGFEFESWLGTDRHFGFNNPRIMAIDIFLNPQADREGPIEFYSQTVSFLFVCLPLNAFNRKKKKDLNLSTKKLAFFNLLVKCQI